MIIKLIKTVLAILFFICLTNMPYGYYQLVRFVALVGFAGGLDKKQILLSLEQQI